MSEFKAKLALFPVKEKKNEKGPDQTGAIEISEDQRQAFIQFLTTAEAEEDYQGNSIIKLSVSTWTNEMKDGRKYLKGAVTPPYKPSGEVTSKPAASTNFDAEVPF